MAFCPHCGTQLADGSRFCSGCGNPTPDAAPVSVSRQAASYYASGAASTQSTWLCSQCGYRLNGSHRVCPVCGAMNPGNPQIMAQVGQQIYQQNRATKSFSTGLCVAALIVGIILCLVHMVMLVMDPPMYLIWEVFVGAVSGGAAAVFSIIGIAKKEPVFNIVGICCGISVWMLFMYLFLAL